MTSITGKKYTTEEIKGDDFFDDFLHSRPLKESTIKNYTIRIKGYCNFIGKTPTELINEATEEQLSGMLSRDRKVNRYLKRYARYMENEEKKKPITVQRTITDIKTFYKEFDIESKPVKTIPHVPTTVKDIPTMDEIKKTVRNANSRDKALILMHLSSGLGSYEIRHLKYKDFLEALNVPLNTPINSLRNYLSDTTVPMFIVRRGKNQREFFTFCSPECAYAIIDYLEEMGKECEYLFTTTNCNQISESVYMGIFRRMNDKNGLGFKEDGRQRRFTSHQLRRIFATNLFAEHVDKARIDFMMGHRADETTEAYFKMVDKLRDDYISGLNSITLNKVEIIRFDDEKTRELTEELMNVKRELALVRKVQEQKEELSKFKTDTPP